MRNVIRAAIVGVLALVTSMSSTVFAQRIATGSGFFITTDGYFVTSGHVIEEAKSIAIRRTDGKSYAARVVRVDANNDIAILKVEGGPFQALSIEGSQNVRRGDRVFTMGFPNVDVQGMEPKYTEGVISSLTGVGDAPTEFQISVQIQSGNSGGPLVSALGNVVGVVQSKLSASAMIRRGSSLPENVNYAIKSNYLLELISTVPEVKRGVLASRTKSTQLMSDLATLAEDAVGLVAVVREAEQRTAMPQASPSQSPLAPPPSSGARVQPAQSSWAPRNDVRVVVPLAPGGGGRCVSSIPWESTVPPDPSIRGD